MDRGTFYSTAAQVIPVLLILGVIESRLVSGQLLAQVSELGKAVTGGGTTAESIPTKLVLFVLTKPVLWVVFLLAGEVAAFLALWLGDNVILAIVTGFSLGYGFLLVLAGSAMHLTPAGTE